MRTFGPRKLQLYFSLPFMGNISVQLGKDLIKILCKSYPYIDFKPVFTNKFTIASLFTFKDKVPVLMRSSVVYIFNCPRCSRGSYIGATSRRLRDRICEHKGVSVRTQCSLSNPSASAIRDHARQCNTMVRSEDFTILEQPPPHLLRIVESLLIKELQPSLNSDESSTQLTI